MTKRSFSMRMVAVTCCIFKVGNGNGLIDSKGERVALGRKIVKENRSTEDLRKINPTWVVRSRSNVSDILSEHEECECV